MRGGAAYAFCVIAVVFFFVQAVGGLRHCRRSVRVGPVVDTRIRSGPSTRVCEEPVHELEDAPVKLYRRWHIVCTLSPPYPTLFLAP